jgi:L-lactate dehydrogenase complex protein LldG
MTTREQFIGTVRKALGRSELPAAPVPLAYRHTVHTDVMKGSDQDELARVFMDCSKEIGANVFETTKERLNDTIRQAIEQCRPGAVIAANDPLLKELGPALASATNRMVRFWNAGAPREEMVRFAEEAAVGIAVAKLALAESATVLFFSHEGCGRSVTLLPESNVYIIPKSLIRPRLTQGMAFVRKHKDHLPSSVNFVSGPSATSDIELVRVVGVHGPVRVSHIFVHDM